MSGINKTSLLLFALLSVIMFTGCEDKEEVNPSTAWATATIGGQDFTSVSSVVFVIEEPIKGNPEPWISLYYKDAMGYRLALYVPMSLQAGSEVTEGHSVVYIGKNGTGHGPPVSATIKVTYHDTEARLIKGTFSGYVTDTRTGLYGSLEVTDGKFEAEY